MAAYKKFFNQALSYNAAQSFYSSSAVGNGPFEPSYQDVPSDIRVEPDTGGQNDTTNSTQTAPVGHKVYRFVQLDSGSASLVNGDIALIKDTLGSIATSVVASGIGGRNLVAGVATGALTAGNYGFLQIRGYHPAVNTTAGTPAQSDVLIASATAKQCTSVTAGTAPTYIPVGVAVAAQLTSTTNAARLMIPE